MSHFHLTRTRTRERTPDYDTHYSRPLVHCDDDGYDDYPYSSNHKPAKHSRALTIRNQPSQLERYNIWSDQREKHSSSDDEEEKRRRSCEPRSPHKSTPHRCSDDDKSDAEEREFRLKVQATFGRPKVSHHHHHHHHETAHFWPSELFRRKEKCVDEDWETRERSRERRRRDIFWCNDDEEDEKDEEKESWSRYRRIKRTRTEEFRPLSGWRRNRVRFDC